mmetsp:Transcript_19845/g.43097  ORF Transcript_19845/g.43097 Transcript_19845/m.43097 type:complete len:282 (-) Transcript_19845:79-924(-)
MVQACSESRVAWNSRVFPASCSHRRRLLVATIRNAQPLLASIGHRTSRPFCNRKRSSSPPSRVQSESARRFHQKRSRRVRVKPQRQRQRRRLLLVGGPPQMRRSWGRSSLPFDDGRASYRMSSKDDWRSAGRSSKHPRDRAIDHAGLNQLEGAVQKLGDVNGSLCFYHYLCSYFYSADICRPLLPQSQRQAPPVYLVSSDGRSLRPRCDVEADAPHTPSPTTPPTNTSSYFFILLLLLLLLLTVSVPACLLAAAGSSSRSSSSSCCWRELLLLLLLLLLLS